MTLKSSLLFAKRLVFPRMEKKSSARRSLLGALLCIGISLVPLVVVISVSNGMIEGITQRIIGLSSSHLQVNVYNSDSFNVSNHYLAELSEKLESVDGIVSAYPEIQGMALASSSVGRCGAAVRAVPADLFEKNHSYASLFSVLQGSVDLSAEKNTAIIGQKIAADLNLNAGSKFRLITAAVKNGRIIPKVTTFTVAGIVSCGYQELDALWVFIPIEKGFSILPLESSVASVKVETEDAFSDNLIPLSLKIQQKAGSNTRVYRWYELHVSEYENFASTKTLLMFIMLLIVLVACVNIFSALVMLSMERRREIAVLKSLGADSKGISFAFLVTGFLIGFGGLAGGIPIGLVCAVNINRILFFMEKVINFGAEFVYLLGGGQEAGFSRITLLDPSFYLQSIPVAIPFFELMLVVLCTLLLTLLASVLPAIRAGREKPLETLRKI